MQNAECKMQNADRRQKIEDRMQSAGCDGQRSQPFAFSSSNPLRISDGGAGDSVFLTFGDTGRVLI
jgi:hypothetical protein